MVAVSFIAEFSFQSCCFVFDVKQLLEGTKTVGVIDYTNQTTPKHFGWKKCLSSTPVKIEKLYVKRAQNWRCTSSIVNNHYAKFEYKGMKTVGVTDYTNQTPSKHFWMEKMSKFNTPKNKKIYMKCVQNDRCKSSICEQSLCQV